MQCLEIPNLSLLSVRPSEGNGSTQGQRKTLHGRLVVQVPDWVKQPGVTRQAKSVSRRDVSW